MAINYSSKKKDPNVEFGITKEAELEVKADMANKAKFLEQDLLNPDIDGEDLYTPTYKRNKKSTEDQAGMLSLFNARKDQILAGRRTPGMSQTRF